MKTAILGGSFDPVHNGHLSLASEVIENTDYTDILFIPAGIPPHKMLSNAATVSQRLEMLEAALLSRKNMNIWDGELRREGRSFTIDTVRELGKLGLVSGKPGMIIGDDLVDGFLRWREAESLVRETEIIVARRIPDVKGELPFSCLKLDNRIWPYSSSEVRDSIGRGEDFSGLLPNAVSRYIMENRLYGYRG